MSNGEGFNASASRGTSDCLVSHILTRFDVAPADLAKYVGTSLVSVVRWERGDIMPDARAQRRLAEALACLEKGEVLDVRRALSSHVFASRGARKSSRNLSLFDEQHTVELGEEPGPPILTRLRAGAFWGDGVADLSSILAERTTPAVTVDKPIAEGVSAGKNTYTYDAHTYHTKVPPQGIADVLRNYLPSGGVVLDPFAGSGMTGVAARTLATDVILNELSPAASFIAERFTLKHPSEAFATGVRAVCDALKEIRRALYTTKCRVCGKDMEILFTVWSYQVRCYSCDHEFILWDHCRSYGRTVREHKILSKFPCPSCKSALKKSRLKRTSPIPVLLGYKCCTPQQVEHSLTREDHALIRQIDDQPCLANGFVANTKLPDGINLSQPKRHGLTSVDRFYTSRNLTAMSQLWQTIHRLEDAQIAGFLAFVFTSLYQRVTRLSEFRFWGGSGNTAHFNVPYISNEANVFVTFERKARSIQDHLETTARAYGGRCVVRTGSATDLGFLPDQSVDLVFTDPPFGANINYSEMNILWESWFGEFTDVEDEAIVNRFQGKDVLRYGELMTASLRECHRVLRDGHWMILVFMNSSQKVWDAVRDAITQAGFSIERVDIFDKQHGTFKQFVSENTAGCDLLLHCKKVASPRQALGDGGAQNIRDSVMSFLANRQAAVPMLPYLHVDRGDEIDYRMLYSEFLGDALIDNRQLVDFVTFRTAASAILK